MEEEFYCGHQTDELLICVSDACVEDDLKHVVCTKCCFLTHDHGIMNFKRLTSFEKHCFRISPLLARKTEIEENVRTKFKALKEQLLEGLQKKEYWALTKLNKILSNDISVVVKQAFVKNEIIDLLPDAASDVVNRIKDVNDVAEQLNEYQRQISAFGLDENFIYKNNINDYVIPTERYQNSKSAELEKVKTQSRDSYRIARTKYIEERQDKQHNGMIVIDLEEITNIPAEIVGESFSDISSILKSNFDLSNLAITIKGKDIQYNPEIQDIRQLCKKKFFSDLGLMKSLQDLNLTIGQSDNITIEDVTNLENALLPLQNFKKLRASYYGADVQTMIYDFPQLVQKLGSSNVEIRVRTVNT